MNWRRGLLLAGVHLAVAGSLIAWQEVQTWQHEVGESFSAHSPALLLAAYDEEQVPDFCTNGVVDYWVTSQQRIVQIANLPVVMLSGWILPCPPSWTLAGFLQANYKHDKWPDQWKIEIATAICLCVAIPIQWLLIGGFPLFRSRRWWWLEPGMLITIWTLIALVMVLIPVTRYWSEFPIDFAAWSWLYWICLLLWKSLRCGWWLVRQRTAATHPVGMQSK
ncbi:MAG: hypothetical protein WAN35_10585 [Terracidiphilus sp.]